MLKLLNFKKILTLIILTSYLETVNNKYELIYVEIPVDIKTLSAENQIKYCVSMIKGKEADSEVELIFYNPNNAEQRAFKGTEEIIDNFFERKKIEAPFAIFIITKGDEIKAFLKSDLILFQKIRTEAQLVGKKYISKYKFHPRIFKNN